MTVYSGGITVRSIKIGVTHTQHEDITIGAKNITGGGNTGLALGAWNVVPPAQTSWSKTFDITDKYFPKKSNGFVDFVVAVSSSKANGCNVGWRNLRYSLVIV